MEMMLEGFAEVFTPSSMALLLAGVVFGNIIGFLPGLGGVFALAILIPFVYKLTPFDAFALLLGTHAVINTGGAISSILINCPGEAACAATCFDGYPMARNGKAGVALGAAFTSSAMGGVFAAVFLLIMIPLIRPIVMSFGPPEIFMLIMLGISYIASLGTGSTMKAVISGIMGLMLAMVGFDPQTGDARYNFGTLYLFDGVDLVPLTVGLFAIGEMISVGTMRGKGVARTIETVGTLADLWEGIAVCFRKWWLILRCSSLGALIGLIPGLGGTVSSFITYGFARQVSSSPETFGRGNVEGVIAPESANNAKEGGNLVPTLGFGIPGGAGMALLLGAFMVKGIDPGPGMLEEHLDLIYGMIMILALANVIGAAMCMTFAAPLARLTLIRGPILSALVVLLCFLGSYGVRNSFYDIAATLIFGLLGYVMIKARYPRAPLLVGMVLGKAAELNFHLSVQLFGNFFLFRPITFTIFILLVLGLTLPILLARRRKGRETHA
ncbi:MAG: tripartite tricarboxylate transporter permease [Deltaproteobacteria bacterium]|nr:tripartite tricarboxylate transporter permease [Deltaproteobacteria bacterium]